MTPPTSALERALARAHEQVANVSIERMNGDNLAVTLCTHFDDGEGDENESGWTEAATAGYEETIAAIRKHYDDALRPALIALARRAEAAEWQDISTAPKDGTEIDIWVSGPGSRRIADCRWGMPSHANWGDRYGDDKNLPYQWVTRSGSALDRRNGIATHWMRSPEPPSALITPIAEGR